MPSWILPLSPFSIFSFLQGGNVDSWGAAKPRNGLRPRDSNVPAAQADGNASAGRSMSQLLQSRSEAAVFVDKPQLPSQLISEIDEQHKNEPLHAVEYVNDIYGYYRRVEPAVRITPDYMSRQADINDKMRAILIDWLVDVHLKFKLMPETLYLTVNLIDRFLEAKQVSRKHLQLVGVTAMLVASKYEEIWAPEVRDFVYISDRAYTRDQILNMEKIMLNVLRFNLTVPTPLVFLNRFVKASGIVQDRQAVSYAQYLVELSLPDYGMLRYPYSMIAAAAVYASNLAHGRQAFPTELGRHSGYTEKAVRECACWLAELQCKAPTASLTAVYKKYGHEKLHTVAKLVQPHASLVEA